MKRVVDCPFCGELDGILIFSGLLHSTCWLLRFLLASSIKLSVTKTFSTIRLSGVSSKTAILSLSSLRSCFFCLSWSTSDLSSAISLWVIVPSAVSSILCLNVVKCALCALVEASSFGNSSDLIPESKTSGSRKYNSGRNSTIFHFGSTTLQTWRSYWASFLSGNELSRVVT